MTMTKKDLLKISVNKDGKIATELNGNSAKILAALDTATQDILNGISENTGVNYNWLAEAYCNNIIKRR